MLPEKYRSFKLREYFKIFNDDLCIEFQEACYTYVVYWSFKT